MDMIAINDIHEPLIPLTADHVGKKEHCHWGNYEKELMTQHHTFTLELNEHLFRLGKYTIGTVWFILILMFLIWSYHIIWPISWHYLDHAGMQTIERILFSSALISVGSKFFGKFKILESPDRR